MDFNSFAKMPRLSRECIITEKIDGTNGQIAFDDEGQMFVGSRNRWITPDNDNMGFAAWAYEHEAELRQLGPGRHFGEWWGQGIQRKYGMDRKVFSLFNVGKWNANNPPPPCCAVVPLLFECDFDTSLIRAVLKLLKERGSMAAPGYMNPEGIAIYHTASKQYFKKTYEGDEGGKGK